MKTPNDWLLLAAGAAGAALLTGKRRDWLGSPVEGGVALVTPHGHFSAHREGPPVHLHQGVDLAASPGVRVLAIGDGVIVATDPGLGKIVRKLRLDRSSVWPGSDGPRVDSVVYADLGKPLVAVGDRVRRGDPVALVGSAGFFHFAVKEDRGTGEGFFDSGACGLRLSRRRKKGCGMRLKWRSPLNEEEDGFAEWVKNLRGHNGVVSDPGRGRSRDCLHRGVAHGATLRDPDPPPVPVERKGGGALVPRGHGRGRGDRRRDAARRPGGRPVRAHPEARAARQHHGRSYPVVAHGSCRRRAVMRRRPVDWATVISAALDAAAHVIREHYAQPEIEDLEDDDLDIVEAAAVLGVSIDADADEIRRALRARLCRDADPP